MWWIADQTPEWRSALTCSADGSGQLFPAVRGMLGMARDGGWGSVTPGWLSWPTSFSDSRRRVREEAKPPAASLHATSLRARHHVSGHGLRPSEARSLGDEGTSHGDMR